LEGDTWEDTSACSAGPVFGPADPCAADSEGLDGAVHSVGQGYVPVVDGADGKVGCGQWKRGGN